MVIQQQSRGVRGKVGQKRPKQLVLPRTSDALIGERLRDYSELFKDPEGMAGIKHGTEHMRLLWKYVRQYDGCPQTRTHVSTRNHVVEAMLRHEPLGFSLFTFHFPFRISQRLRDRMLHEELGKITCGEEAILAFINRHLGRRLSERECSLLWDRFSRRGEIRPNVEEFLARNYPEYPVGEEKKREVFSVL